MTLETALHVLQILKELWPLLAFVAMFAIRRWHGAMQYEQTIRTAIDLAGVLVADTERTVRDLKDPAKPGTWDATAQSAVKQAVLARLRASLGPGLATLERELAARGSTTHEFLDHLVEGQLEKLRAPEPVAARVAAPVDAPRPQND